MEVKGQKASARSDSTPIAVHPFFLFFFKSHKIACVLSADVVKTSGLQTDVVS